MAKQFAKGSLVHFLLKQLTGGRSEAGGRETWQYENETTTAASSLSAALPSTEDIPPPHGQVDIAVVYM